MRRFAPLVALLVSLGNVGFAHEGNDHIRGVVTLIAAHSITVRTTATATKTVMLDDKTVFQKSGGPAHMTDLTIGDRVVIDVPEKTTLARLIRFGPPKK